MSGGTLADRHDDRCPVTSADVHPIHVFYDCYAHLAGSSRLRWCAPVL
ncbi:hypothetical protein [Streptomyces sp. TLI_185]|nr:hypothetical protein [Streptomyces sp. TLI_185]